LRKGNRRQLFGNSDRFNDMKESKMKRKKKVGKRKSKSWRRRNPICCICTTYRWMGNIKNRFSHATQRQMLRGT